MSLNRLVAFNMTQYKKLVWMDSDVLVLKVRQAAVSARATARGCDPRRAGQTRTTAHPPPAPPLTRATRLFLRTWTTCLGRSTPR
jgi:hypothetical protein